MTRGPILAGDAAGRRAVSARAASGRAGSGARPRRGLPAFVLVPALAGLAFVLVPLLALLPKVEWGRFIADVTDPVTLAALGLSVRTGAVATICCLVLGVPLALLIARAAPRRATVLRTIVTLPLVLPPLVGGVALLAVLGRTGLFGPALESVGVSIPFTPAAVVFAQTFVAMPFLVISVEGALRSVGTDYERVAAGLGAGRWRVLTRITLPLVAPGLLAGIVLCFARAVGEFGATALFAGNKPGVTQTIPMAIYTAFNGAGVSRQAALALSVLLIATSLVVILAFPTGPRLFGGARPSRRARPIRDDAAHLPPTTPEPAATPAHGDSGAVLTLDLAHTRGTFTLEATLDVPAGRTLAVVGANGAGKSTLLDLIGGTLTPDRGTIRVGARELSRGGGRPRVVPAEERRIGTLTQDALLFPHLSAVENIAFGPRARGIPARAARAEAADWLERVGLPGTDQRRPRELSGGQQQRVALARALATRPGLLLLDEPLAALDVATAPQIRLLLADEIRRTGVTAVVVTHDLLDAIVLADEVAVLAAGRIVESGPTLHVVERPRTPFAAALAGVNLLTDPATGDLLRIRPADLALHAEPGPGRWAARVLATEAAASGVRVRLIMDDGAHLAADVPAAAGAGYRPGGRVHLSVRGMDA
ncbi:molybdate ABC transporter permease subunit [Pseudactinotalea sp. HY158]|nr:molybdate ABC transporter permease subunit [Pseudactinotalea sp. HY158]